MPPGQDTPTTSADTPAQNITLPISGENTVVVNGQRSFRADLPQTDATAVVSAPSLSVPISPTEIGERERVERVDQQLREKRMQIDVKTHLLAELTGKMVTTESALRNANESVERITADLAALEQAYKQKEGGQKHAGDEMRQNEIELRGIFDSQTKLEKEIQIVRREIESLRTKIARFREDRRILTHKRDGMKRAFELGHSGVKTDTMHIHEKRLEISRLEGDARRHEMALTTKKRDRDRLKTTGKDVRTFEADIRSLEGAQRHTIEALEKTKREIAAMEGGIKRQESDSLSAEREMHNLEKELHRLAEESRVSEKEIAAQETVIAEKEVRTREMKQRTQELLRDKEQGRRAFELTHFTAQKEFAEISEKRLELVRYQDEAKRKSDGLLELRDEAHRIERMIFDLKREIELVTPNRSK